MSLDFHAKKLVRLQSHSVEHFQPLHFRAMVIVLLKCLIRIARLPDCNDIDVYPQAVNEDLLTATAYLDRVVYLQV